MNEVQMIFVYYFPWRMELVSLVVRKNLFSDIDILPAKNMEPVDVMWLKTIKRGVEFGDSPTFTFSYANLQIDNCSETRNVVLFHKTA